MRKIIKNSHGLIFVSPAYKEKLQRDYPLLYGAADKISIIPNGVDEFWISNKLESTPTRASRVLFVGKFDKNKNLPTVYKAVKLARRSLPTLSLSLVGGNAKDFLRLTGLTSLPSWLFIHEKTSDKTQLKTLYAESGVFLMPSFHETFGLVFIEALSQGCPFIYTTREGVDRYFPSVDFCHGVNPLDTQQIASAILKLMECHPTGISPNVIDSWLPNFDWNNISKRYHQHVFC